MVIRQNTHCLGKFARPVVDADPDHVRKGNGHSRRLQRLNRLPRIIHNQPKDSKIAGIRHGNRADIDLSRRQDFRNLGQASLPVFYKNGKLLNLHSAASFLDVPFVNHSLGLTLGTGQALGFYQADLRRDI